MSKLVPVGHRIVVKPDKLEDEKMVEEQFQELNKLGLQLVKPDGGDKREKRAVTSGVLVSVGPQAWHVFKKEYGDTWTPWAKVGDRVEFARYAGELVYDPETKDPMFIMNDEDLLAIHEA